MDAAGSGDVTFVTDAKYAAAVAGSGAAAVIVDSRFSYAETITTGFGTFRRQGHVSDTDVRFGPYLMGQFITEFARHTFLFAGVQFYMLDESSLTDGRKEATLNLDRSLFVHAGLGFSF